MSTIEIDYIQGKKFEEPNYRVKVTNPPSFWEHNTNFAISSELFNESDYSPELKIDNPENTYVVSFDWKSKKNIVKGKSETDMTCYKEAKNLVFRLKENIENVGVQAKIIDKTPWADQLDLFEN